ncbi:MAG: 2OG-Fe(II) oxygenase family protein [Planctomycetota bacterium]|nr:2OG-Fe(II) oxygenase family protein [Planctomycetota bacterium]
MKLLGQPTPFFTLLDINAADVDQYATAIGQLREGIVAGIIVRNVYESALMQSIVSRLERHDPPFLKTWFPEKFKSWFYGQNLNLMETDPDSYFRDAAEFHQQMRDLFPEPLGIDSHLMKLLSRLDGKRPYRAAPGPEPDQNYMITTFRGHSDGGYIPAHCDNEQSLRPAYEHLATLVTSHMYSMVLLIGKPVDGGLLEVFDYRVESKDSRLMSDDTVQNKPDIAQLSSVSFPLNPGDMIIVDSGRYLHRVTPVIGKTTRWVACSFMAHARERNAAYCWG